MPEMRIYIRTKCHQGSHMDELLKGGQTLGVFAIFAILVIREVLSYMEKRRGEEGPNCNLRNGALHQLTTVYERSLEAAASFDHLAKAVERLTDVIERYNENVNELVRRSDPPRTRYS